jgi:hypothetical protein
MSIALCIGWVAAARAAIDVVDPGYTSKLIATGLPDNVRSMTIGSDGLLYGVADSTTVAADGDLVFSVDLDTGVVDRIGQLAFVNPATDTPTYISQAPAAFGDKLYLVDWINGHPARVDRFDRDLTGAQVVHANNNGQPVSTPTSKVAFSTGGDYGTFGYMGGQGDFGSRLYRLDTAAPATLIEWANAGLGDARSLKFATGGAWGDGLYVGGSSVLNGFVGAPGQLVRVNIDGAGNFVSTTTIVSEASGLLDYPIDMVFDDPNGMFGGDLLLVEAAAGGSLVRIDSLGNVSPLATGARTTVALAPNGDLLVTARNNAGDMELHAIHVPEPISAVLIGAAAPAIILGRRRRRG